MEDKRRSDNQLEGADAGNQGDFPLYTEKIVVSPLVKYRKLLNIIKGIIIAVVILIIACIGGVLVHRYIKDKEAAEAVARKPLVLEKDEYNMYSRSPSLDSEEPDLSSKYYWIKAVMYNISKSIVQIGDNTVGIVAGEVDGDYIVVTEYNESWGSSDYYIKVNEEVRVSSTLLNTDKYSGLAVLAVNKKLLNDVQVEPAIIKMGNSYDARQNEIVIAIGRVQDNSEGYATGFITDITSDSGVDMAYDILRTNVELKAGDYALVFDMNSSLIGISYSVDDNNSGEQEHIIGISSLKPLIEQMSKAVPVPYLGIKSTNITKDVAEKFHFPEGIYVTEVELDSPAYKAGIQAGDIIYGFNDEEVMAVQTLSDRILSLKKDNTVKVRIKRTGKGGEYREIEYSAKLAAR